MMKLEVVDSASRLHALTSEWSALARSIASVTPFQLPEWVTTWWAHFGSGQLHVMAFRADGEMVAIAPCFLHDWNGKRQMTLIGSGVSDYLEPLIDLRHSCAVLDALQQHLAATPGWNICDWQDLWGNSPLRDLQFDSSISLHSAADIPCSEVQLTGTFEEFWRQRSKDLQRNVRRYAKRALLEGELQFAVTSGADTELLNTLIDLHGARWRRQGEPGMIEANGSADFLRAVAAEFAAGNMLRFFNIRYQSKVAALVMTFLYAKRVFAYMSAFDPQFETLGLGRRLLYEAIRRCYDDGYRAWNFLRGDEPYKLSWGAEPIAKSRITLTRAC